MENPRRFSQRGVSPDAAASLQRSVEGWRKDHHQEDDDDRNQETTTTETPPAPKGHEIRVFARLRPLLGERLGTVSDRGGVPINEFECVSLLSSKSKAASVVVHEEAKTLGGAASGRLEHRRHVFDGVFSADDDEAYDKAMAPLVEAVKNGRHACAIMFGQTNSGKTHTANRVAERAIFDLCNAASPQKEEEDPLLKSVSCVEVGKHNKVRDLFSLEELSLREDDGGDLRVVGASEKKVVATAEDETKTPPAEAVVAVVREAFGRRSTRATKANEQSSRSHAVLTLKTSSGASLVVVDLAGSERRQEALFDDADALEETKSINTALSALKDCIRALVKNQDHVPFRRSALTRILRPALDQRQCSGRMTSFVAHLAPTNLSLLHTKNTLDYCAKMRDVADDDRTKRDLGPERWTAARLRTWVNDTFHDDTLADAFNTISGKTMATIWRGELVRRVEASGFSEAKADQVYDTFHDLLKKHKQRGGPPQRRGKKRARPKRKTHNPHRGGPQGSIHPPSYVERQLYN
mmetsp:Transcript_20185/g.65005  ORF Transcript_20185/g.65005 Transcript_20185/m.65005 type:complete len:523 (-) Transcript_20185:101-1669(-)